MRKEELGEHSVGIHIENHAVMRFDHAELRTWQPPMLW